MTREEHLQWAKDRAIKYFFAGDLDNAIASMLSDLAKHPALESHPGIEIMTTALLSPLRKDPDFVRRWIVGFN